MAQYSRKTYIYAASVAVVVILVTIGICIIFSNGDSKPKGDPGTTTKPVDPSISKPTPPTIAIPPPAPNTTPQSGNESSSTNNTTPNIKYDVVCGKLNASDDKWPWQISLMRQDGNSSTRICGAALFNGKWAVTAAHCVESCIPCNGSEVPYTLSLDDRNMLRHDGKQECIHQDIQISFIMRHPGYKNKTHENDIAVFRLKEPIKYQENIHAVVLAQNDSDLYDAPAYALGWDHTTEHNLMKNSLREVPIPIQRNSTCDEIYNKPNHKISLVHNLCAGDRNAKHDACFLDSGAPLVIRREKDKRWVLAGIRSAEKICEGPNRTLQTTAVYARISTFQPWIDIVRRQNP